MPAICHACDREFASNEALIQHLHNASAHNPQRNPRRGQPQQQSHPPRPEQVDPTTPRTPRNRRRRRNNLSLDQFTPGAPLPPVRRPRARLADFPSVDPPTGPPPPADLGSRSHPFYRCNDDTWYVGTRQVPLTGNADFDNIWYCVMCHEDLHGERALRQHMNDASYHIEALQEHPRDFATAYLEACWYRAPLNEGNGQDTGAQPAFLGSPVNRWDSWEERNDFMRSQAALEEFLYDFMDDDEWPSGMSTPEVPEVPGVTTSNPVMSPEAAEQYTVTLRTLMRHRAHAPAEPINAPSEPPIARALTPDSVASMELETVDQDQPLEDQAEKLREQVDILKASLRESKEALKREKTARQCTMCYERNVDTVTQCGHQFCSECVARWQRAQRPLRFRQAPCPMCRASMGQLIKVFSGNE